MLPEKSFFALNHPMTIHLQAIVYRVDQLAREVDPTIKVPKPKVVVAKAADPNAYAVAFPRCQMLKAKFSNPVMDGSVDYFNILQLDDHSELIRLSPSEELPPSDMCQNNLTKEDLVQLLNYYGESDEDKCVEFNADGIGVIDSKCFGGNAGKINIIDFRQISDFFVINSGLLTGLSEKEVVATVLHELMHYYKAHPATAKGLNYLYQLTDHHNENEKPQPVKNLELEEAFAKVVAYNRNTYISVSNDGFSELHPVAFNMFLKTYLLNSVRLSCDGTLGMCGTKCDKFNKLFNKDTENFSLIGFPLEIAWPTNVKTSYRSFVTNIRECAQKINLAENTEVMIKQLAAYPLEFVSEEQFSQVKNFWELLIVFSNSAEKKIEEGNKNYREAHKKAYDLKLGYYTLEQEADELSLEVAYQFGLNADDLIDLQLTLLKNKQSPPPGELGYEKCLEERNNGYKNFISVGNFSNLHHSGCFRAYNLMREFRAHQNHYQQIQNKVNPYQSNEKLWNDIVKSLN